jgi:hypothetical protein
LSWPRRVRALSAFLALLLASSHAPLRGQSGESQSTETPKLIPRTHEQREARFRAEHRIVLNVEVTDAAGSPITGLTAGDFTLMQDRQPQPITSFRAVNGEAVPVPPQVMLVLDAENNSSRDIANDRKGIEHRTRPQSKWDKPGARCLRDRCKGKLDQDRLPAMDAGHCLSFFHPACSAPRNGATNTMMPSSAAFPTRMK